MLKIRRHVTLICVLFVLTILFLWLPHDGVDDGGGAPFDRTARPQPTTHPQPHNNPLSTPPTASQPSDGHDHDDQQQNPAPKPATQPLRRPAQTGAPGPHHDGLISPGDGAGALASAVGDFGATDRPLLAPGDPLCAHLPGSDPKSSSSPSIVLIVKSGATEVFGKLPTQLGTILRCVPELLVFSDKQQTVAGVLVRDSLETVLEGVKAHPDFALYRAQQACDVSQADCTRHRDKGTEGWNLDKYKNIHVAEKAWNLRPGRDWYVVIDADTYLFWTTLVALLARLDPAKKMLLGSISYYKDFPFAHGGSGYIASRRLMEEFVGKQPGIGNRYDKRVIEECCGDWMFSKAVHETTNVSVTNIFPTINGDKVWSMSFGDTHWCHPLATMHHVDSEEMSMFWEFETTSYLTSLKTGDGDGAKQPPPPILLRDLYTEYFVPRVRETRDDWSNISEDIYYVGPHRKPQDHEAKKAVPKGERTAADKVAHKSAATCRAACEARRECFQWLWHGEGVCALSKSFKIGYPMNPNDEPGKRTTSGWMKDRIDQWVRDKGDCEAPKWPEMPGAK